jgi:outer membrane protein TolC
MLTLRNLAVRTLAVATSAFLVIGCAVQPQAFTRDELRNIAAQDHARVSAEVPALQNELSLPEAIARALKYNLDHRTKLLEQAYAAGALETAYYDLLPKLTAEADYSTRNNDPVRRSQDSITGAVDQSHPFISSDRTHTTSGLGLSWNMLDFGVSYFNAKQQADRVLIASERRRKAMHELMRSVQAAYWRALSAQKLHDTTRATIAEAESALADARKVEYERLKAPAESLRYQRALLENLRTLESVEQELAVSQLELAGLINLPPGHEYRLTEPSGDEQLPQLTAPAEQLEAVAIANNPDLREENYNARIAARETRKALLKLLPGISLDYGYKHDTDSYLINNGWTEAGVQVSANLLNAFSYRAQKSLGKVGERLAETRRMALQMAVVTQVHVAAQ